MGVKIREKPKGSGVWWVFVNHHGKRTARKVGEKKQAQEVAKQIDAKLTLGINDAIQENKDCMLRWTQCQGQKI